MASKPENVSKCIDLLAFSELLRTYQLVRAKITRVTRPPNSYRRFPSYLLLPSPGFSYFPVIEQQQRITWCVSCSWQRRFEGGGAVLASAAASSSRRNCSRKTEPAWRFQVVLMETSLEETGPGKSWSEVASGTVKYVEGNELYICKNNFKVASFS